MSPFLALVGPNGAGKTNIVRGIELLGAVARTNSIDPIAEQGYGHIIRRGVHPSRSGLTLGAEVLIPTKQLRHSITSDAHGTAQVANHISLSFSITVSGSLNDEQIKIKEELLSLAAGDAQLQLTLRDGKLTMNKGASLELLQLLLPDFLERRQLRTSRPEPTPQRQPSAEELRETIQTYYLGNADPNRTELALLPLLRREFRVARYLKESLEVYRIRLDSSALKSDSTYSETRRANPIGSSGEGLAAAVHKLKSKTSTSGYDRVLAALQEVFPRVETITVERLPPSRLVLQVKEYGITDPLDQDSLSDGVLHALGLLIALEGDRPGLLVIEEPENAIHPWPLRSLVARMQDRRGQSNIIITTHSETVVNAIVDPSTLLIVEQGNDGTVATRASDKSSALASILRDSGQQLGDVWLGGLLGGTPTTPDQL